MKQLLFAPRMEYLDHAWKYFINETYLHAFASYPVNCIMALDIKNITSLAKACDGLVLSGGYDLHAAYFHQSLDSSAQLYQRPVDLFDFTLLDAFIKEKKPILGICRGFQVINVYFHGTLKQDIDKSSHEEYNHAHSLLIESSSLFSGLFPQNALVNSYHHQAIDVLGKSLLIQAKTRDGINEAFIHETLPIIGVQWHPEKLADDPLIPYFVSLLESRRF
ncbi:MAG: gamma-glutamyl-gamma-aminobutyrate hydrolase family protein [Erysipelotrichaceae bacterium]|nr:gamma-glutamyl-gamma-aminobutyrate hydrolase family protein [Erysipelotrichaceae bacterium]MCI9523657.1 gamma-glutamyl-gamma-aminobutyrate hydrolase family protein [Erysipelotrichaceae bacterium]